MSKSAKTYSAIMHDFFSNMQLLSKKSTQADIEQMCRKIVGISMPDSNFPLEFFNPSPLTAHLCANWL